MRVLLVEDEPKLAEPLLAVLARERYETAWAADMASVWRALAECEPDLAVVDVMLPGDEEAGFDLAHALRGSGYRGALMFLTARDAIEDRVRGLDVGGDDYLVKPFSLMEFLARVRALLRRQAQTKESHLQWGDLSIDFVARRVLWRGREARLTEREFELLELFALHPERVFGVEELVDRLFPGAASGARIVRVYVHHVRAKLTQDAIATVPGGYRLGP